MRSRLTSDECLVEQTQLAQVVRLVDDARDGRTNPRGGSHGGGFSGDWADVGRRAAASHNDHSYKASLMLCGDAACQDEPACRRRPMMVRMRTARRALNVADRRRSTSRWSGWACSGRRRCASWRGDGVARRRHRPVPASAMRTARRTGGRGHVRFLYHAPEYVTLLRPALEGWRDPGTRGRGPAALLAMRDAVLRPAGQRSCSTQNLASWRAGGVAARAARRGRGPSALPGVRDDPGRRGRVHPEGGMVDADAAARLRSATGPARAGAEVRELTPRRRRSSVGRDRPVRLTTDDGTTVDAGHVVDRRRARGPTDLLPELQLPIRVTAPDLVQMRAGRSGGRRARTASPSGATTTRCTTASRTTARASRSPTTRPVARSTRTPSSVASTTATEQAALTAYLRERFPTSDLTFAESRRPASTRSRRTRTSCSVPSRAGGRVSLVVGLNHAFKFAPVIGRILADLATTGSTAHPIERFRVDRFAPARAG